MAIIVIVITLMLLTTNSMFIGEYAPETVPRWVVRTLCTTNWLVALALVYVYPNI